MDNLTCIIDDIKILISFLIVLLKTVFKLPNKYLDIKNENKSIDQVPRIFNFNPFFSIFKFIQFPELISDNIYLGNIFCSINKLSLKQNNIGLIINCSKEIPNFYNNKKDNIEYFKIEIFDDGKEKLNIQTIKNTINKIVYYSSKNNKNKNILVHCFAGRSRSVSIIVCYLIYKYKMSPNEAILYILKKRDYINPSTILYDSCISYYNYITRNK